MSNFGRVADINVLCHIPTLKQSLKEYGYYLIRNCQFTHSEFIDLFSQFGDVIGYSQEDIDDRITEIGTNDQDVICGKGQLPLHFDGDLEEYLVDHVFLYAQNIRGEILGGETIICDVRRAMATLPVELREIVKTHNWKFRVCNDNVTKNESEWRIMPFFTKSDGETRFNLYMPFDAHQPKSWDVSVQGLTDLESKHFFQHLDAHMSKSAFNYRHQWCQDDLLIFDNRRVLHSRVPFSGSNGIRQLWRGLSRE